MSCLKTRLDKALVEQGFDETIESAQARILAGEVLVDDVLRDKPGELISALSTIRVKERCPYVSRGGYKLEKGLDHFSIDVTGQICIDIGASTGGFTDCLLQRGAKKVIAVDVAYGQLAWKIRQDARVTVIERFNARKITRDAIGDMQLDLAVMDASFISITKLLPAIGDLFDNNLSILTLIKPQFELPREDVGPGGVVTGEQLHKKAIQKIEDFAYANGWKSRGVTESPITGPKGNREFLIYLTS